MEIICSTKEFNIYMDKKKHSLFKITNKNNHNCLSLFYSIVKPIIVNSATIVNSSNDNNNNTSLIIKTMLIKTFNQFKEEQKTVNGSYKLPYTTILNIIICLSKQLSYLLEIETKCFYNFDPDNILVVDDCKFLYLSTEYLKDIKNNNLYIYNPIKKNIGYLSPELHNVSSIPIIIHYKTIFYSLGLFIINNLVDHLTNNDIQEVLLDCIENIRGTKLYYFLERCLQDEPTKRFLIYV
jgi:hypothetical protein